MKVRELIAALEAAMNPEAEVVIDDADTNWYLRVTQVGPASRWNYTTSQTEQLDAVAIGGDYVDVFE